MSKSLKPTEAELEILQVLWEEGPSSVRIVHDALSDKKEVYYTTTLKTMQVMNEKGMLSRNTDQRSHIYAPLIEKKQVEKNMWDRMAETMFSGSSAKMIMSALGHKKPSPAELAAIKSLLEKMDKHGLD